MILLRVSDKNIEYLNCGPVLYLETHWMSDLSAPVVIRSFLLMNRARPGMKASHSDKNWK